MMTVTFTPERPPIPTDAFDWRAYFDAEEGREGTGPTKLAAALALYHQCETIEETLAAIVGILRADLEDATGRHKWPASQALGYRWGYQDAIRVIEGIE